MPASVVTTYSHLAAALFFRPKKKKARRGTWETIRPCLPCKLDQKLNAWHWINNKLKIKSGLTKTEVFAIYPLKVMCVRACESI